MKRLLSNSTILFFCFFLSSCAFNPKIKNFPELGQPRYVYNKLDNNLCIYNNKIKIISYNIRICNNTSKAIELFKNNKNLQSADIILLQEMCPEAVKTIAQTLQYNSVYYPSAIHPENNKEFGNAILSKWPINNDKKIILPYINEDNFYKMLRIAVEAEIEINNSKILVYSTHLGVFITPKQRQDQLETIINSIPIEQKHIIIGGDFNTYKNIHVKTIKDFFQENDFTYATKNIRWTYKYWYLLNKKICLDHIFTKGFNIINSISIPDRTASDHLPICVELEIE